MNAAFLLIPFIIIRYVLLSLLSRDAMARAAHFAETVGAEKLFYGIYQASTLLLLGGMFFLRVTWDPARWPGLVVYGIGTVLCILAMIDYARPREDGFNRNGIYRLSRNPMYVGYFVYFLGCVLLTASWPLFLVLLIFQFSAHWIILAEERWCIQKFGDEYIRYMNEVRRYL
jgi:protein-S-isoprenylcysteine O-methyltransferase Ste14